jgi:NAD+ synthase (glutamine-hydrolysing)
LLKDFSFALAQINTTVGDLEGNTEKIVSFIKKAKKQNAKLVVFPELTITGYPPKDLLLKPHFVEKNLRQLEKIRESCDGITAIVGFVAREGKKLFNSAAVISDKKLVGVQHKKILPNYDVFDEKRYFKPAKQSQVFTVDGLKFCVTVCGDIWVKKIPCQEEAKKADFVVNISASPFYSGKTIERKELVAKKALELKKPFIYCNLVGGQDDLVFDGCSLILNERGKLIAKAKQFEGELLAANFSNEKEVVLEENKIEQIYNALILGLRDYISKNGFKKVVIGSSGGIDSAVVVSLAVLALGKENVLAVAMPSRISSPQSLADAKKLAENLGIKLLDIPIGKTFDSYSESLSAAFKGTKQGVAEENIQARIRGNLLMALSNKFGYLVLGTGNKSELAVGYATLYGDMACGLAVISDVPKMVVYELAFYMNEMAGRELIPKSIIDKPPSAELRPNQKDSDDIPEYRVLDKILNAYVEEHKSRQEIIAMGFDSKTVENVVSRVDRNEYKRHQAAPGIKITPKAFGSGRRMPITNKFKG